MNPEIVITLGKFASLLLSISFTSSVLVNVHYQRRIEAGTLLVMSLAITSFIYLQFGF